MAVWTTQVMRKDIYICVYRFIIWTREDLLIDVEEASVYGECAAVAAVNVIVNVRSTMWVVYYRDV